MIKQESAMRMIKTAIDKATELGVRGSVAVVDEGGNLKAFVRMDGSLIGSADGAKRKAYTAAVSGMSTAKWFELYSANQVFGSIVAHGTDGMLFLPGGEPIFGTAGSVGGVGFSGGAPDQDVAITAAALAAAVVGSS